MPKIANRKEKERLKETSLYREYQIERDNIDESSRTVELSFSSEAIVTRQGWLSSWQEVLGHEKGNVDLTRINEMGVLLWNHKSDVPIGAIESAWLDENERKCRAKVRFDDDEESEKIFRKVVNNTLKGVSVGYRVTNWEIVDGDEISTCGRFTGPCEIARKWEPLEISIASVPADATVGVGRSLDEEGDNAMPKPNERVDVVERVSPEDIDRVTRDERVRTAEILAMGQRFEMDLSEHIRSGDSVEMVRKIVMDKLAEERKALAPAVVTLDEKEKFRNAARDALCLRGGLKIAKFAPGADELRSFSLRELAREALAKSGESTRGDMMEMIGRALTTSDLPVILGGTANLSLMEGWESEEETWPIWVDDTGVVSDFKIHTTARAGDLTDLDKVREGGEYKYAEISETFEQYQVAKFGKLFSITREAIVNDDLGAITDIPKRMGEAARRKLGDIAYAALTSNPKMGDGKDLFHANHGNLMTAAGISFTNFEATIEALGKAIEAMKSQKDIGGKRRLNIRPMFFIAPVALEAVARRFFAQEQSPMTITLDTGQSVAMGNGANPYAKDYFTLVFDPRLDDVSQKAWYLAARKGKTVRMFFLNGAKAPYLEQRQGWSVDGTEYKVRIEAGAKAVDWRGLVMNPGA
ncbi:MULTISPECIES: prohead protease/major capsid protein fusion protein [unclassified Aminobacterium]|uniref:prohead protease/major capsid protein fusion protein n=1 Tax=unclassified Aminobacterium TaxID=2685012 RepID=UPI000AB4032A|nr:MULTISPECIES: prohead protease/major capsid protein fusion protein [unclassified Aminobacterium]